jgi:CheY-like chemotaxis protein
VDATRGDAAAPDLPLRALLLDDDEDVRVLTRIQLEKLGFATSLTGDGAAAIEAYRQTWLHGRPFNAVILDLNLPGSMGGPEVLEALRRIDPDVKAWLSTGCAYDPMVTACRSRGFQGVLLKPFGRDDLQRALADVIHSAATRDAGGKTLSQ